MLINNCVCLPFYYEICRRFRQQSHNSDTRESENY